MLFQIRFGLFLLHFVDFVDCSRFVFILDGSNNELFTHFNFFFNHLHHSTNIRSCVFSYFFTRIVSCFFEMHGHGFTTWFDWINRSSLARLKFLIDLLLYLCVCLHCFPLFCGSNARISMMSSGLIFIFSWDVGLKRDNFSLHHQCFLFY